MIVLNNFAFAFLFSFIGSIPPGTLNLTVIQFGMEKRIHTALRFSAAAALVEYPYAWIAVKFESLITSTPWIIEHMHLTSAIVMTILGIVYVWPTRPKATTTPVNVSASGFRRGLLLGILNPLAIPFWIGITAYLKSQQWIDTSSALRLHAYLLGVTLGALTLLICLLYLCNRIALGFTHSVWVKRIPGMLLLCLGLYSFVQYLLVKHP